MKTNTDSFVQRLYGDGVDSKLYTCERNKYETCAQCNRHFILNVNLPQLLKCGHVCCQFCLQYTNCVCCLSKTKKVLKIRDYRYLIQGQNASSSCFYNFVISIKSNYTQGAFNQPETATIGDVLSMHPDFDAFSKSIRVAVVIGSMSKLYSDIKDKKLKQLRNLRDNKNGATNMILIRNQELGGFLI